MNIKKGVTVISVALMVAVMSIIMATITISGVASINNAKKLSFSLEIANIEEAVNSYYLKNNNYPTSNSVVLNLSNVQNPSKLDQFGSDTISSIQLDEIDMNLINMLDLQFGNKKDSLDIYALSSATGKVYYLKGIKAGGKVFYTLTDELKNMVKVNRDVGDRFITNCFYT